MVESADNSWMPSSEHHMNAWFKGIEGYKRHDNIVSALTVTWQVMK